MHPGEPVPKPVAIPLLKNDPEQLIMLPGLKGDVEKTRPGDVDGRDPGRTDEPPPQHLGDPRGSPATTPPSQLQGDIRGVIPAPRPRRGLHLHPIRHGDAQLVGLNGATHGVQHSAGELGGCHGTSVWEEGGTSANRFRPSDRRMPVLRML